MPLEVWTPSDPFADEQDLEAVGQRVKHYDLADLNQLSQWGNLVVDEQDWWAAQDGTGSDTGRPLRIADREWWRTGMGIAPDVPERVNTLEKFLTSGAVYTLDEATMQTRLMPCSFQNPGHADWEYMLHVVRDYEANGPLWACEKSRRMMVSWLMISLYLYRLMTVPHAHYFMGSRNYRKSCFMLGPARMKGVYLNISSDIWPNKPHVEFRYKAPGGYEEAYCEDTDSIIEIMPEGPDQLREYTVTGCLCDEFAMWRFGQAWYTGARATISGGGRLDFVSTPKIGSFMYRLLYRPEEELELLETGDTKTKDQAMLQEMRDHGIVGTRDYSAREVMHGVEVRDTASGMHVCRVHYSANPLKQTEEWSIKEHRGVSVEDWRREYEIDWMTGGGGHPVFTTFNADFHISEKGIPYDWLRAQPGLMWIRGWDFGHNAPACEIACVTLTGQIILLDTVMTWDGMSALKTGSIGQLTPEVIQYCNMHFGPQQWVDWVPPDGFARKGLHGGSGYDATDFDTCCSVMESCGIVDIRRSAVLFSVRQRAMNDVLMAQSSPGKAKLLVNRDNGIMCQAFRGAYRWKDVGKNSGLIGEDVLKNAWSHPMDASQALVCGVWTPVARPATAREYESGSPADIFGKMRRGRRR